METYFASAARAAPMALQKTIANVSGDPLMSQLMNVVGGVIAVVNEQRQVVAVSDDFLAFLGIEDPGAALGLRPGEVLGCEHATKEPAGCGTTPWCSSCGAAIAMVTSLGKKRPTEKLCALTITRNGKTQVITLCVRAQPITIEGQDLLLLFLHDVTRQQQRAGLERAFFHDINNVLSMLLGSSDRLMRESPSELARTIHQTSSRLVREVAIQRCLAENSESEYEPAWETFDLQDLFDEVRAFFANHPATQNRSLTMSERYPQQLLHTDISLLLRVLQNMIINALEASDDHGQVKAWIERDEHAVTFLVWNSQHIPPDVKPRIFQRHYSTKQEDGRGIGTFAMKLLGEGLLGGTVSFTTSVETGTVFRFRLPLAWHGAQPQQTASGLD
jgi:K+-sensing histidine kinase KdpD